MRVAVLGPLVATANDSAPVIVPGADERLLLAVLAAQAPCVVPAAQLLGALRADGAPEPDGECLQAAVHRLRAALEPGLPERSSGQYVLRRGSGYALAVPRGDVDALRFTDLVLRGHARVRADPAEAEWLLSTAIGLWRGEPYGEWPDAPFARAERSRLTAARTAAEADLVEARGRPRAPATPRAPAAARVPAAPRVLVGVGAGRPSLPPPTASWDAAPNPLSATDSPAPPGSPPLHTTESVAAERPRAGGPLMLVTGLVVLLVAALFVARLSGRSEQRA